MKLYTSPYYTPYSLKILSLTCLITKKNSKNKAKNFFFCTNADNMYCKYYLIYLTYKTIFLNKENNRKKSFLTHFNWILTPKILHFFKKNLIFL